MKEILSHNYPGFPWNKHLNKASFFIRITIDPEDPLLHINASNVRKRSVMVYKDDLVLEDFDWHFGMTPAFRDEEFFLTPDTLEGNLQTASLPMFLGHPHNEKYRPPLPSGLNKSPTSSRPSGPQALSAASQRTVTNQNDNYC